MKRKLNIEEILGSIFKQYYSELIAEIDKADTLLKMKRIYDSGKVLEVAFKNLLKKLLPNYVGITRGLIFDSNVEKYSQEIDIILYDSRYFNGFVANDSYNDTLSFISIDTVLCVISIKKTINNKSLIESINNIKSVYELFRKPITNQLHNDIKLENPIHYKNGNESNRVISCIISYKNELLYKKSNKQKVRRSEDEINKMINQLSTKFSFGCEFLNLFYSIDGFYLQTQNLKKIDENEVVCFHTTNDVDIKNILSIFILQLQEGIKGLVKCTPNISKLLKVITLNSKINTSIN